LRFLAVEFRQKANETQLRFYIDLMTCTALELEEFADWLAENCSYKKMKLSPATAGEASSAGRPSCDGPDVCHALYA